MCVCALVFSYICLFQASLVRFTSATFFLLLGQLCGFGACNKQLYEIPNYTSHFKTMRTAGWGVIKGPSSNPPAVASLPGVQTTEQHKHSQRLLVPPLRPPASPCVSPRAVWAGCRGLCIPQGLLDLSSLSLSSRFWNPYGLLAATQPTWQETSEFD